ncbi:MAG: NAD(+) kinase, partial [Bacteroidetes bacterium]|nr:NAD(+) kinase [Bacteroidota bacterium]
MKIAIYGRPTPDNTSEHIQLLFDKLNENKTEIFVHEPFYNFLKQNLQITDSIKNFNSHLDIKGKVDYMLSVGG